MSNLKNPYSVPADTGYTWMRQYHSNCDCPAQDMANAYDKGILLLGWYGGNWPSRCWLTKTGVNGEVLWEKTMGDGQNINVLQRIAQNSSGEIFLTSIFYQFDIYGDPMVVKLNACGEKQWCRVFSTPGIYDGATTIISMPDGGCILTLRYATYDPYIQYGRITLMRLDSQGNELWRRYIEGNDPNVRNEENYDLRSTSDLGYLLTGNCYYIDNSGITMWLKCYFVKTDSVGNIQWETVAEKLDTSGTIFGGVAWYSLLNQRSDLYYSSTYHYNDNLNTYSPAILKLDTAGHVIGIYDLTGGYEQGSLAQSAWVNNSVLIGSAGWFTDPNDSWSRAVKFDTLGNLLQVRNFYISDWLSYVQRTFDGKFLFFGMRNNSPTGYLFNSYLFKLNENLEYDSLYTRPFTYDSLCPHPVVSDTIPCNDCGLIVGLDEHSDNKGPAGLEISPNPAKERVHVLLPESVTTHSKGKYFNSTFINSRYQKDAALRIYNISGVLQEEIELQEGQKLVEFNVSDRPPGMYLIRLITGNTTVAEGKVVVVK